jgi:beta-lactamase class D
MRLAITVLALAVVAKSSAPAPAPDVSRHFTGLDGTFVLLDGRTNIYTRYNTTRAEQRFPPCSTYKIPHTAILLESGIAKDADHLVKYDPAYRQPSQWAKDFTLEGAFKASALWYYQVLGRLAGMPTEARFVRAFAYGNTDTSGGLDRFGDPFWVDGSLRISANEQVAFLQRLHDGRLGLSARTTQITKDIMVAETTTSWRLSAKTGACQPTGEQTANWYVGYVERGDGVYYFALELGDANFGRAFSERVSIARAILADLGIIR